jgi:hypothetical protein
MQHLNNDLNKFKTNDSTHVKMLIVQEMWMFLLNHSHIIVKHWVACVSIYYNMCKMQFVNIDFNILEVNGSTHVHMLIIEKIRKKSFIRCNINVGFYIITCVLINYDKCTI